jgi:uncharacterized protein YpbB
VLFQFGIFHFYSVSANSVTATTLIKTYIPFIIRNDESEYSHCELHEYLNKLEDNSIRKMLKI